VENADTGATVELVEVEVVGVELVVAEVDWKYELVYVAGDEAEAGAGCVAVEEDGTVTD
jgi:hypothetical protein